MKRIPMVTISVLPSWQHQRRKSSPSRKRECGRNRRRSLNKATTTFGKMLFLRVFNDDDDEKKKRKQQKVMMKLHQTRGEKRGVFVSSHRGGVLGGVLGGK